MGKILSPTSEFEDASQVGGWMKEAKDAEHYRRLLCIKLLMGGKSQKEVSEITGFSRTKVYGLVCRWNREGRRGLEDKRKGNSRPSKKRKWIEEVITEAVIEKVDPKTSMINVKVIPYVVIHGQFKKKGEK